MSEKRQKQPRVKLGLLVRTEQDQNWFHVKADPIIIGPDVWEQECRANGTYGYPDIKDDTIRNPSDRKANGLYLNDFHVNSQGNNNDGERRHLYGWEVRFQNVYSLDLEKAEQVVKTLRTVHARMEATDKKLGRPKSFGQYLGRVAAAIGADQILMDETPKRSGWSTHAEMDYRWMEVGSGVDHVDWLIRKWVEAGQPATAQPVAISA